MLHWHVLHQQWRQFARQSSICEFNNWQIIKPSCLDQNSNHTRCCKASRKLVGDKTPGYLVFGDRCGNTKEDDDNKITGKDGAKHSKDNDNNNEDSHTTVPEPNEIEEQSIKFPPDPEQPTEDNDNDDNKHTQQDQ